MPSPAVEQYLKTQPLILRDGDRLIFPPACPAEFRPALEDLCLPRISAAAAAAVEALVNSYAKSVHHVVDPDAAAALVAVLAQASSLAIDFETMPIAKYRRPYPIVFTKTGKRAANQPKIGATGLALDPFCSKVRLLSVFDGNRAVVFDVVAIGWPVLAPMWSRPLIAANAVFEAKRLIHEAGVEPEIIYDVIRTAALTHGLAGESVRLDAVAKAVLGLDVPKDLAESDWGVPELSRAKIFYSALDSVLTFEIHRKLRPLLTKGGRAVDDLMSRLPVPVARMELNGSPLDRSRHLIQIAQWEEELPKARAALHAVSGGRDIENHASLRTYLGETLSPDELAIWPGTDGSLKPGKTKVLKVDKPTLAFNAHLPIVDSLLAVRKLQKDISSFGVTLLEHIHPDTDRLHPSFRIAGATTGRFSSSRPNFQQMPSKTDKSFRHIFRPPRGRLIVSCDFSQIELRVLAQVVRCDLKRILGIDAETILDRLFATGEDIHAATARLMFDIPAGAEVPKDLREAAKTANFSLVFGMRTNTFFKRLRALRPDVTRGETDQIWHAWRLAFPDVVNWQSVFPAEGRQKNFVETWLGRPWWWHWRAKAPEDVPEHEYFRAEKIEGFNANYALSHRVQGSAAELMQLAIVGAHEALKGTSGRLIATVHDELVAECDADEARDVAFRIMRPMGRAFCEMFPLAPFLNLVDTEIGESWGTTEKIKFTAHLRRAAPSDRVKPRRPAPAAPGPVNRPRRPRGGVSPLAAAGEPRGPSPALEASQPWQVP